MWGLLLAAVAALVLDLPETALAAPGQVGPVDCPTGIHACVVHAKGMDACPLHRFCLDDDWNYNTDHVDHPCLHWTRWYFWGCDGGHSELMFVTDLRTDDYCYKWPLKNFPSAEVTSIFGIISLTAKRRILPSALSPPPTSTRRTSSSMSKPWLSSRVTQVP